MFNRGLTKYMHYPSSGPKKGRVVHSKSLITTGYNYLFPFATPSKNPNKNALLSGDATLLVLMSKLAAVGFVVAAGWLRGERGLTTEEPFEVLGTAVWMLSCSDGDDPGEAPALPNRDSNVSRWVVV